MQTETTCAKPGRFRPSPISSRILVAVFALILALASPVHAAAQAVTMLPVVTAVPGSLEDEPAGVIFDANGNLYIANSGSNLVQRVNLATGVVTTVAGGGQFLCTQETDSLGDGCPATSIKLFTPTAIALNAAGDLFIAEPGENLVRVVPAATGIINIYAGGGNCGGIFCGDGGPATSAWLNYPDGLALDAAGNLFISDRSNNRVRKVTAATGIINTVAGGGLGCAAQNDSYGDGCPATSGYMSLPGLITVDAAGNLYIADEVDNLIRKVNAATQVITSVAGNGTKGYSGDGGQATAAELDNAEGVTVDAAGNLYIADTVNNVIRLVSKATGIISTMAGGSTICVEHTDSVGDGCPALYAQFSSPYGVALDPAGNLYLSEYLITGRIREVSNPNAPIRFPATLLNNAAMAENVYLSLNTSQTVGDIIALEGSNTDFNLGAITGCVIDGSTFNPPGTICTIPVVFAPKFAGLKQAPLHVFTGAGTFQYGMEGVGQGPEVTVSTGVINTVAGSGTQGYAGDNGPATLAAMNLPLGLELDLAGNLYFADANNSVIRKVSAAGIITTVAGNGTAGYSGDNGAATAAQLNFPESIALDAAGNLLIADTGNNVVRKVSTTSGIITTVAGNGTAGASGDGGPATSAEFNGVTDVAVDQAGSLYLVDYVNHRVRVVGAASGIVNTVAGGGAGCAGQTDVVGDGCRAINSELVTPIAVGIDPAGNWYVNDISNSVIREVNGATGIINNLAGDFTSGYGGDSGPATSAEMSDPYGFGVDAAGDLYVADTNNNRIRQVYSAPDSITTLAGNGTQGFAGDGSAATGAEFANPYWVKMDQAGNLYIADTYNNRIRTVSPSGAPLSFPATPVGSSSTETVVVTNIGNQPLTFLGFAATANFAVNADASTCSTSNTLPAGSFCKLAVACQPTATGNVSGTLTIADNALYTVGIQQTVALSCVGGIMTNTTLMSTANPSTGGETVTFTATVGAASGGKPTGTVTFYNDLSAIGTIGLSAGVAKLNYSALTQGTHSITASYNDNATDAPSTSAALSQVVNLDTTTTFLATAPNPSTPGQSVNMTATVTPGNGVAATGTVSSYSGATLLGNASLSGGVAMFSHAFNGGNYNLSAKYTGSNYKSPSTSNTVKQVVNLVASATALASSANPSSGGQTVTFTATVTGDAPTGAVAFTSNGTTLSGCGAVTLVSGAAKCSTPALAVGTESIVASYAGNTNNTGSASPALSQVVNQATTMTALASSLNPSTGGQTVTFTATVTASGGGTATGTVKFYNGATSIGTITLNAGVAKLNYSALTPGTHSITASYSGSAMMGSSTSPAVSQVVNIDTTTTALATAPNPSTTIQSVTLTATVTPGNGVTATGTVGFYSGTTLLGNVALSGGVATLSHTFTTTGTYNLTAKYDGSTYQSPSTSNTIMQTVNPN